MVDKWYCLYFLKVFYNNGIDFGPVHASSHLPSASVSIDLHIFLFSNIVSKANAFYQYL